MLCLAFRRNRAYKRFGPVGSVTTTNRALKPRRGITRRVPDQSLTRPRQAPSKDFQSHTTLDSLSDISVRW